MREAQKIIKENELIKLQRDQQKKIEKEQDNKMLERLKQEGEEIEKKR